MKNLKLMETDTFNEIATCDFWANANDDYLVTREQIGRALGYSNPTNAIKNIHLKHKDRLDKFSTQLTLGYIEGDRYVERERILYNRKGIMEICRWSRQPLANDFMDWCWDIMDKLLAKKFTTGITVEQYEELMKQNTKLRKQTNKILEQFKILIVQGTATQNKISRIDQMILPLVPPTKRTKWKTKISQKVMKLAQALGCTINDERKSIYGKIYSIMREDYDINLDLHIAQYLSEHTDKVKPSMIDVIDYFPELKELFEKILDNYVEITATEDCEVE